MGIVEKIERCHNCIYYQEFKTCSVRDSGDKFNEWCQDFKRVGATIDGTGEN